MKNEWYIPKETNKIGNYKALKNKISKETSLFGKYGEIWEYSNEKIGISVRSNRIARKYFNCTGLNGDEFFFIRPLTDLNKLAKIIKVPRSVKLQLRYVE